MGDAAPTQSGWNYYDNGYATGYPGLWDVGSGSQELNGTYDMMGNVWEWMENNAFPGYHYYFPTYNRSLRGGGNFNGIQSLTSTYGADYTIPSVESVYNGFRVAAIPEPCTVLLLGLGGVMIRKKGKGKRQNFN